MASECVCVCVPNRWGKVLSVSQAKKKKKHTCTQVQCQTKGAGLHELF